MVSYIHSGRSAHEQLLSLFMRAIAICRRIFIYLSDCDRKMPNLVAQYLL
ncbi:MAG: hypothetical protein KME50_04520 [Nostoc desertorum CM1-VF14]|nr:hypothetical protein [Nostoc desertorum CM1-VF14]